MNELIRKKGRPPGNVPMKAQRIAAVLNAIKAEREPIHGRINITRLADATGKSRPTIYKWFEGTSLPQDDLLPAIASSLAQENTAQQKDYLHRLSKAAYPGLSFHAELRQQFADLAFEVLTRLSVPEELSDKLRNNKQLAALLSDYVADLKIIKITRELLDHALSGGNRAADTGKDFRKTAAEMGDVAAAMGRAAKNRTAVVEAGFEGFVTEISE